LAFAYRFVKLKLFASIFATAPSAKTLATS